MTATRNDKYANSLSNCCVIMMLKSLKIIKKSKFCILEARSAELKQTTTANRLLIAQDTS